MKFQVDISILLSEAIRRTHHKESMSYLFQVCRQNALIIEYWFLIGWFDGEILFLNSSI